MDGRIAATAIAAGVKRWWGDEPRPLHLPGAVANAQWTGPRAAKAGVSAHPSGPVVLEPTPAQLARGIRVLWIESTSQTTAMAMLDWARGHGWSAGLSRSRYLSEPSNRVALARRGRALEHETVCLRLRQEPRGIVAGAAAALRWDFDVELGKWSPMGGVMVDIEPGTGRLRGTRTVGITEMQVIMGMRTEKEASGK